MSLPLISVIIPTYNRAAYLAEAIASVTSQTWSPLELIVVNDGSTDETAATLAGLVAKPQPVSLRILCQDNAGPGAARNAGVAVARGEFLAFLDSDDLWLPDKLSRQMAVLQERPETDAVYGHGMQFLSPELSVAERTRFAHLDGRVLPAPIAPSLLIRRGAFARVGPFDPALRIGVDMDWYSRLCELPLGVVMLAEPVYRRRIHTSNLNLTHAHEQSERLLVLKRVLDRRRVAAVALTPDGCGGP